MFSSRTLQPVACCVLIASILAASGFRAASAATRPGQLECFQLRQTCLAHARKLSVMKTEAAAPSADAASSKKLGGETCEKLYLDARETGVWAAYKGFPAVKCAK